MANELIASGALDEALARIDADEPVGEQGGLLNSLLKAALEPGLNAELTEHLGYDACHSDAASFPNARGEKVPGESIHLQ